jgi:ribbon-helix-helix CopG family protein
VASRDRSDEPLIGVRVGPSFAKALASAAAVQGTSKSSVIRRALIDYLLPRSADD